MTQLTTLGDDAPGEPRDDRTGEGVDVVRGIVIAIVLSLAVWATLAGAAYAFAQVVLAATD
ncbi:hypothetical protein [Microbacterium sp. Yaish 1]|uniref:hypothetical protein n=1 Tax=Microbacterium sp. Yaish 1 TaxID=2025014 RepID=UPI000B93AADC|nr:hypothetical protein [Microbacterium sp. Yaish 1]OYC97957.1 hypothetical protein CI089_05405 [Microbacterium sp. Yaish 1]